ncbi:MAG: trehalose-phosphatase [Candidatus Nanopelagicales bacterium]
MTAAAVEPLLRAALERAAETERLLVAVDFDGTLAPIVSNRDDARALPESLEALADLVRLPATSVAVVSGRALVDLAAVGNLPDGVLLVGSHGAELDDLPRDDVVERRDALLQDVRTTTSGVPGVDLEVKPAGVAVHVRAAARSDAAAVLDALRAGPARLPGVSATPGKEVLELSVVSTDKGQALDVLRRRTSATAAVFLGDDVTDESAIERLHPGDVGVKVGPGATAAEHRVPDPVVVADVLALLAAERTRRLASS